MRKYFYNIPPRKFLINFVLLMIVYAVFTITTEKQNPILLSIIASLNIVLACLVYLKLSNKSYTSIEYFENEVLKAKEKYELEKNKLDNNPLSTEFDNKFVKLLKDVLDKAKKDLKERKSE